MLGLALYTDLGAHQKHIHIAPEGGQQTPKTNPRMRTGLLPVEQYELLLDGQRLLIKMEVINKNLLKQYLSLYCKSEKKAKNFLDSLTFSDFFNLFFLFLV